MVASTARLCFVVTVLAAVATATPTTTHAATPSNVLLVVVDNLRPSLGAYGVPQVLSPNIDALLSRNGTTLFSRAYCQLAWCSPSRNSWLSGRSIDQTQAWGFRDSFRDPSRPATAAWVTLPGYFKQHGFDVTSYGKVMHPNLPPDFDFPASWTAQPIDPLKPQCPNGTMSCAFDDRDGRPDGLVPTGAGARSSKLARVGARSGVDKTVLASDGTAAVDATNDAGYADSSFPDSDRQTADLAIAHLRMLHRHAQRAAAADPGASGLAAKRAPTRPAALQGKQPFFLAVGFQSPRLPWSYPRQVAARYPPASQLAIAQHAQAPSASENETIEWFRPTEIDFYDDIRNVTHDAPMPLKQQHEMRLAYYAAITHVDDQVGRVLSALTEVGADDDTIVVFMADHGQNLGEHNTWSMMSLMESALRVPLAVYVPPASRRLAGGASDGGASDGRQRHHLAVAETKQSHVDRRAGGGVLAASNVPVYPYPVELTQVYPTLAQLAGLPLPNATTAGGPLAGRSVAEAIYTGAPLEADPGAFSQITRCFNCTSAYPPSTQPSGRQCTFDAAADGGKYPVPCCMTPRQEYEFMGMSIRTRDWRYSVYCRWLPTLTVDWNRCADVELFDHRNDAGLPYDVDNFENTNLAGTPALAATQAALHERIVARFAYP